MTARDITTRVLLDRWRRNFVLPNYTPPGWWECDVFEVTEAGYFREYEVKTSVADFRADKAKARWMSADRASRNKHDLLAAADPRGPVKFWYVTPAGLLAPEKVPAFAGLIEMRDTGRAGGPFYQLLPREVKPAPQLHRERPKDGSYARARDACYWRLLDLIVHSRGADDEPHEWVI